MLEQISPPREESPSARANRLRKEERLAEFPGTNPHNTNYGAEKTTQGMIDHRERPHDPSELPGKAERAAALLRQLEVRAEHGNDEAA